MINFYHITKTKDLKLKFKLFCSILFLNIINTKREPQLGKEEKNINKMKLKAQLIL